MKKVIKSLILILVLAMAFAVAPAFAEGAPTTHNKVYQGLYSGTTADSGAEFVNEFASIVYGQLNGTAQEFGMEITFYGDSVWVQAGTTVTRKANAANGDGNYGIALIKLPEGYYAVRAYADGEYGEYVYFTVGESYKTSYTVNHYLETLESGVYEEAPAESEIVENVSIGATVTAESMEFAGYTYNSSASSATALVAAGGTTVINLYYTRNTYEITYDYNGGTVGEATSETATQRLGTELTVSTNPTKEGAWFYGWSTTPYVNNMNDVAEGDTFAPSLDTVEVVDATNTTYYAVWYEAYWLEFGNDTSNDLIIDYHTGSPANHVNEFYAYKTNWTTSRDGLGTGPLSVHTLPKETNYTWFSIKLPKIPASEIAKVTISMKDDVNGSAHYIVSPNQTRDDLDDINATSIPNSNWVGGDSYKDVNFTLDITNTIKSSPHCQDTLDFVAFFAQGYGHNHVQIESIYIDCAQDNTASFTTSVIKEQQDGSYAEDESLKYTSTAYIGTKALGNYKAIEGYTYDATQSVYATVLADGSAVAQRVYELNEMNITYNYNGGTVGEATSETATVKYGSPLGVATNPTKEGAWFYGWATSDTATINETVETVTTATEYYAVWYEAKWLEFGNATTNRYITSIISGQGNTTPHKYDWDTPNTAPVHSTSLDGVITMQFVIDQMVAGGNYKSTIITMPKVKVADIDSITIKMVVTKGEGGNLYVVADRFTEAQNDASSYGNFLAALQKGEYTFTVPQSYFTSKDWIGETIETLQFTSNGWANQVIQIDSIMINYKEASNVTATVTKQYYKQGADLQYTLDDSLTETVTAYIGTPLNPAIKEIAGTEYNAEMSTIPATVAAGENVMSLYYDALPVTVTYHFNGGTNGTEATSVAHEQMGGSALADAETLGITKEGAYFYGWNTVANTLDLTTVDATATDGAAYYAVWYEESWLSLNNTDSNQVVFNGSGYQQSTSFGNTSLAAAVTATEDTTNSTDGYLTGEFQLYRCQSYNTSDFWAHSWAKINLPKVEVSKIESITINAYFRVNAPLWISANGRDYSTWNHAANYTGFTSTVFYGNKSGGFGTGYKTITITADSFTAVGVDTIESLYFDSHWSYQYIKFDSIVINWKA